MAISFVGAGVIWKFVYDYRGPGDQQIGFLNAIIVSLGFEPQAWITIPIWNNLFLMAIMIWIQTGLAMVIFSAALRGVPKEMLEAGIFGGHYFKGDISEYPKNWFKKAKINDLEFIAIKMELAYNTLEN